MGGKSKHTPRTKNNVKPSSSSRSAELLGSTPNFVGFSVHSDLGLVPLAPGFSTTEQIPDIYETNVKSEFQMILKKMTKKDPMTKKKALQEFITSIEQSKLEEIKAVLPLWPKFYQNLSNDPSYHVRELAQTTLQLLASKCKKAIAPYLKQLVPVWLACQFDNYAPAASIASNSFAETFIHNTDRTCEVCIHCQNEIIDYVTQNLIYHTVSTLSGKNLPAEEAQQKYNRLVLWSLKELSFFIQSTSNSTELKQQNLKNLLAQSKFWLYSKNKLNTIRAAMFEVIYNLLSYHKELVTPYKQQLIPQTFQNIDESDALVASHIWGCMLLLQVNFHDWYLLIDFHKMLWPKIKTLLRNNFNGNAQTICPHILPFFSQLYKLHLPMKDYIKIITEFFDNFKIGITTMAVTSKSENIAIIKAYYECLRYIIYKLGNCDNNDDEKDHMLISSNLMEKNVIDIIKLCLTHENVITIKQCFAHTSTLIAYLDKQQQLQDQTRRGIMGYFKNLLNIFWRSLNQIIEDTSTNCTNDACTEESEEDERHRSTNELIIMKRLIQFAKDLHVATPTLEEHKVNFLNLSPNDKSNNQTESSGSKDENKANLNNNDDQPNSAVYSSSFVNTELKYVAVNLFKNCLHNILQMKKFQFITCIYAVIKMFNDVGFFNEITSEHNLLASLHCIYKILILLLDNNVKDQNSFSYVIDIIFQMLEQHPDKMERFEFIKQHLIQLPHRSIQILLLEHLLSHPWCLESETRNILAQSETKRSIVAIIDDGLRYNSKDIYHILHKCFNHVDDGEMLIHSDTINEILNQFAKILLNPLMQNNINTNNGINNDNINLDDCVRFLTLIFPKVCYTNSKYCSHEMKNKSFLCLLSTHLLNCHELNYITDDTLLEVMKCWQMALPNNFIINDDLLKACGDLLKELLRLENSTFHDICAYANVIAQLILRATEYITSNDERLDKIDVMVKNLLNIDLNAVKNTLNATLFVQSLNNSIIPSKGFQQISSITGIHEVKKIYENALFNATTITLLLHNKNNDASSNEENDQNAENDKEQKQEHPNKLTKISQYISGELLQYIRLAAAGETLKNSLDKSNEAHKWAIDCLSKTMQDLLHNIPEASQILKEHLIKEYQSDCSSYVQCVPYLKYMQQYAAFDDNATVLLFEELQEHFLDINSYEAYVHLLHTFLPKLEAHTITIQGSVMRINMEEIWPKAVAYRCLIENYYNAATNEIMDKKIILAAVEFITAHKDKLHHQKQILSYQCEIPHENITHVINAVEYMNLLITMLKCNPYVITLECWDIIRIGLGHWILSLTKSMEIALQPMDQKTFYFAVNVFKLFTTVTDFFASEQQKSSTDLIQSVYDEWLNVFHRTSYLSLFKLFYRSCEYPDVPREFTFCWQIFLNELAKTLHTVNHGELYTFSKLSTTITLDHVCNFLLKNIASSKYSIRILSVYMIKQLTTYFVSDDLEIINKRNEQMEKQQLKQQQQSEGLKWHFLSRFEDYLNRYEMPIHKYNEEFSFKPTEIFEMDVINTEEALNYLMLWDCIINACSQASIALRSVYTSWLSENKYEQTLLHFLFRAMPEEILKNHSTKQMNNNKFKHLTWTQIKDGNFTVQRYACHLYRDILSKLPALVRAWWNESPSRQKNFVDTLTTNFVSPIICNEELMKIAGKKEKQDNMQITVHTSTREVLAIYSIDDVQMELVITLAVNYPLGAVKVECKKQIGGRASARSIVMQLTILLTHQNGAILDGLALWKANLDKMFEGIEECYVCYTVIHQDTCQLPKLTCKTCKKKFHGPCLFKWFTTSNKSTCPICRNVF